MKASELIEKLLRLIVEHGDLRITVLNNQEYEELAHGVKLETDDRQLFREEDQGPRILIDIDA